MEVFFGTVFVLVLIVGVVLMVADIYNSQRARAIVVEVYGLKKPTDFPLPDNIDEENREWLANMLELEIAAVTKKLARKKEVLKATSPEEYTVAASECVEAKEELKNLLFAKKRYKV